MDPNAALETARRLAAQIMDGQPADEDELADVAGKLAETFQALDTWLLRGGFRPDAWQ